MRPILLIEDSPDDVLFLTRALSHAGVANPIDVVTTGRLALDYFENLAENTGETAKPAPILVLLDLQLPEIKGLEVLEWIRQHPVFRTLVVIIHSSSHLDVEIQKAYELGANSFLVKTPSSKKLRTMIELIKAYWLELNAIPSGTVGRLA